MNTNFRGEVNLYIINTNKSASIHYEKEMIDEQKCSAYRSTKAEITNIKNDDKVLLYSNGLGIIARGIADGQVKKKADNGELDAEYYIALSEFYKFIRSIPYNKIKTIVQTADPSFNRPFNVTSLKFSSPASQEIWDQVCKYV
jgi:L-cysteine desulfidase